MKILKGITAASGIAQGVACLYSEKIEENVPHYGIEQERVNSDQLGQSSGKVVILPKNQPAAEDSKRHPASPDVLFHNPFYLHHRVS